MSRPWLTLRYIFKPASIRMPVGSAPHGNQRSWLLYRSQQSAARCQYSWSVHTGTSVSCLCERREYIRVGSPRAPLAFLSGRLTKDLANRRLVLLHIGGKVAVLRQVDLLNQLIDGLARLLSRRHLFPQVVDEGALRSEC